MPTALVPLQVLPGTFAGKKDMVKLQRRVLVRYQAASWQLSVRLYALGDMSCRGKVLWLKKKQALNSIVRDSVTIPAATPLRS